MNKKQNYEQHRKTITSTIDLSLISLRPGEFIHIQHLDRAVEVKIDDDGNMLICVSAGVTVKTFAEVYGD